MNDPAAAAAEKLDDEAIDNALSITILSYDPGDRYPEWSNDRMRDAYRTGYEDGADEMLKPIRAWYERWNKPGVMHSMAWRELVPLIFASEGMAE